MAFAPHIDWQLANVTPERISVPLGGNPDDDWLDRFQHLLQGDRSTIDLREAPMVAKRSVTACKAAL